MLDHLGIDQLFCVIGGSMGAMQVLEWALNTLTVYFCSADRRAARHSAQNIAFHEVGRQAIMADPDWRKGNYLREGAKPKGGFVSRANGCTSRICPKQRCIESLADVCKPVKPSVLALTRTFRRELFAAPRQHLCREI